MRYPADPAANGPSVAIVGGGVAGLSAAWALARAGAAVVLFDSAASVGEARPAGAGASSLPVALLNPWRGRKGDAHPGDLRGLAATWRWADALAAEGRATGAHPSGVLRIPASPRQARAWRARAAGTVAADPAGPGAGGTREPGPLAWLPPDRVPPPYRAPFGALLVRGGGWIEPRAWLAALAASARDHGAVVREGVEVVRAERVASGAWLLLDVDGTQLVTVDRILICVGADPPPILAHAATPVAAPRWNRTRGDVVTVGSGPTLPRPVAGGVYGATHPHRAPSGEVGPATSIGGGHRPAETLDPAAPHNLRQAFAYVVPGVAEAEVVAVWSGVRARTRDGRPWVAEGASGAWWFGGFAGRGFLCAAAEAERLAAAWRSESRPPG